MLMCAEGTRAFVAEPTTSYRDACYSRTLVVDGCVAATERTLNRLRHGMSRTSRDVPLERVAEIHHDQA